MTDDLTMVRLWPAIIWMDRRAARQADALRARIDAADFRSITGLNVDAYHCAAKIEWIRDEEPEVASRATAYLLPGSYLVAWLTGERVIDHGNASSTMVYDVTSRDWSPRLLEMTGLRAAQLGRVADATEGAGTLTAPA